MCGITSLLLLGLFTGLYGFYLECWFGLYSCFSLIFFFVSFVLWLVPVFVCVVVLWVGVKEDRRKRILLLLFFFILTVCRDCVRGGMGEGGFLCVGIVRCVGRLVCGALCAVVLSLGRLVALSRVFSFRQGTYMPFLRKCLKMDLWASLFFPMSLFVGFAYLPHILSLCLGWGRRMFYIRTHAEGDTHIEDVRPVRGGV
nr:MAG TPA: hypothetical protein [Caudoviricetes sp.]